MAHPRTGRCLEACLLHGICDELNELMPVNSLQSSMASEASICDLAARQQVSGDDAPKQPSIVKPHLPAVARCQRPSQQHDQL